MLLMFVDVLHLGCFAFGALVGSAISELTWLRFACGEPGSSAPLHMALLHSLAAVADNPDCEAVGALLTSFALCVISTPQARKTSPVAVAVAVLTPSARCTVSQIHREWIHRGFCGD